MRHRRLFAIAFSVSFASAGCGSDPPATIDTALQAESHNSASIRTISLKDVQNLPEKWHSIASEWTGKVNARVPQPAKSVLESAIEIELFSIHPYQPEHLGGEKQDWIYYERRSLGGIRIADHETIKVLLAAFDQGLGDIDGEEPIEAECYDPRHRIRIKHDGKSYDYDICFDCGIVAVYVDRKHVRDLDFNTWDIAQPVFDAYLTAADVPIAPPFITDGEDKFRL